MNITVQKTCLYILLDRYRSQIRFELISEMVNTMGTAALIQLTQKFRISFLDETLRKHIVRIVGRFKQSEK